MHTVRQDTHEPTLAAVIIEPDGPELGIEDDGDGDGIVQGRAGREPEDGRVRVCEEHEQVVQHLAERRGQGCEGAAQELLLDGYVGQDEVRDVERDERGFACEKRVAEEGGPCFGVAVHVEFGPRRRVADSGAFACDVAEGGGGEVAADGAAHDAEPFDVGG